MRTFARWICLITPVAFISLAHWDGGALRLGASAARAGETESNTFFARGRELRLAGNCKDAVEEFRKAYDAYPEGLGALRNIAECEEELKRPASARRSWWALRTAARALQLEKYVDWDKDAEKAFARLAPVVAKLVVRVKNAPEPRVLINGRPLTPSLLGTELEEDLGEIDVVLDDGSAVSPSKKLTLEAGQRYEVELESNKPSTPTKTTPPPPAGPSPLLIGGGVALGLGGLAAGGFIGAMVVRQNALSAIEDDCPDLKNCSPSLRDQQTKGQTASTLVNVFAIGGGAALATGVGLVVAAFVTAPAKDDKKESSAHALRWEIAPGPDGVFLQLTKPL